MAIRNGSALVFVGENNDEVINQLKTSRIGHGRLSSDLGDSSKDEGL
jgi:hypothetical protein